jgi:hypothetical protein
VDKRETSAGGSVRKDKVTASVTTPRMPDQLMTAAIIEDGSMLAGPQRRR